MSMRINSLFEHDASMKRLETYSVGHLTDSTMPSTTTASNNMFLHEASDSAAPMKPAAKEKGEKGRHRASIACASCRDRRIRVCILDPDP